MKKQYIIAIDGPAGSGKSTVARLVAQRLGLLYVDTGAMYRAFTLKAVRAGVDLEDEKALSALAQGADIDLVPDRNGVLRVLLDGEDVTGAIRTQELTNKVHYAARTPGVREEMAKRQRHIASGRQVVAEGRDIGTVVFPGAEKKFYLDASFDVRARRRCEELERKGGGPDIEVIKEDIKVRDARDKGRAVAPLKKAEDAVYIDTTGLSIDEVVNLIIEKLP